MATTSQIQLPTGYQDATPVAGPLAQPQAKDNTNVSLPAGYEDAVPVAGPLATGTTPSLPNTTDGSVASGAWDALKGAGEGAVNAMGETIQSLPWIGKKIISPESMAAERAAFAPGSQAEKAGQYGGKIAEPVLEFVLGDEALKGAALADKIGLAGKIADISAQHPYIGKLIQHGVLAARMGTVGTADALAHGATLPEAVKTGAEVGVGGSALAAAAPVIGALASKAGETTGKAGQLVGDIAQGEKVAQPLAQAAIRSGVQAAAENAGTATEPLIANVQNQPLIGRASTVLDEHLSSLRGLESDAYDRMDEAAGFDVKAEKAQLANDQYKLKQLGNTDADLAQKEKLTASVADSQARIADAEAKMQDADVDPKEADTLHSQRMAGADLRKALVKATSSDGQTVNINSLLNDAKKLQFAKYGNRLAQFFGSPEAADGFISGLEDAQSAGIQAAKSQDIAKWIGKRLAGAAGTAGLGAAGYEAVKILNDR